MKKINHIGTNTKLFAALGIPLLVVEQDDAIRAEVKSLSGATLEPAPESAVSDGRFCAYRLEPGVVYEASGVEWVPQRVTRHFRLSPSGEVEVVPSDLVQILAAKESRIQPLPELLGTPKQVEFAKKVRQDLLSTLGEHPAREALIKIKAARWFIARRGFSSQQLVSELLTHPSSSN